MMKFLTLLVGTLCSLVVSCASGTTAQQQGMTTDSIDLMCFNIRYANIHDGVHSWENRKEAITRMLRDQKPAILGIQEGLSNQVSYLDSVLGDYSYVGVGRDDGAYEGEYAAIFYDTVRFATTASGNFWLSETPERASIGWDAACIRIASWVKLRDKSSGSELLCINTHFDHIGNKARLNSGKMLIDSIRSMANDISTVVMGDFNSTLDDEALVTMTESGFIQDARSIAKHAIDSVNYTFIGFENNPHDRCLIDHIFVRNVGVGDYSIITDSYGIDQLSDHLPIKVSIGI